MQQGRNKFRVIGGVEDSSSSDGSGPTEPTQYLADKQLDDFLSLVKKMNPMSMTAIFEAEDGTHSIYSVPLSNFTEIGAIKWAAS